MKFAPGESESSSIKVRNAGAVFTAKALPAINVESLHCMIPALQNIKQP